MSVFKKGAVDYVPKPFDHGRLDRAIQEALAKASTDESVQSATTAPKKLEPFKAAKRRMLIEADRVTVCGIEIWKLAYQPHLRDALLALKEKVDGRFVRIPARDLNSLLGRDGVTNSIARRIKDLRERAIAALAEIGFECGAEDVVASGRGGYHFPDWIEVQVEGASVDEPARSGPGPDEPSRGPREPGREPDEPLNRRQRRILAEIDKGTRLRRADIERHTKKNRSTANRDLKCLRDRGLIETHEDGYYVRAAVRRGAQLEDHDAS